MKPAHISHRTEEMPTKLQIFEEQQATKTVEFPITPSLILTATYIGYLSSVVIGHFPTLIEERRAVICMHFHQHKALKGSICIPNSSDRPLISKSINNHMTVLQHYTHHNRSHDTLQGIMTIVTVFMVLCVCQLTIR